MAKISLTDFFVAEGMKNNICKNISAIYGPAGFCKIIIMPFDNVQAGEKKMVRPNNHSST